MKLVKPIALFALASLAIACSDGAGANSKTDPGTTNGDGDGDNSSGDGSGGNTGNDPILVDPDHQEDPSAPLDLGPINVTQGFIGEISGPLTEGNSLWGPGEINLSGPVTVPSGVTLTINPGTHVFGDATITAQGGNLVCNGSFDDPATFFESSFALVGGEHSIRFCTMNSIAETAISVQNARLGIEHFQLQRFGTTGIHVVGADSKISVNFSTLGSASTLFTGDDLASQGVAVRFAPDAANTGSSIENSVLGFLHNGTNIGLTVEADSSDLRLAYSMISGTNGPPNTSNVTAVFYGFPDVTDIPNLDYRLNYYSPALDLANPLANYSLEPAPNGGRANIGYFGRTPGARITSVELLDPNGCEELQPGATVQAKWKSSPNTGPKTLSFSADGGITWEVIETITEDTGSAMITLPNVTTDQALLRFAQDNDPEAIFDESNRPFAVGMPADEEACALEIRCPAGTAGCKPFEVICYTGYRDGQMPTGTAATEPSYEQVLEDLQILAPYTHAIRTYGSGPNLHNGQYVPSIADSLGLDLHMGIWLDDSYSDSQNQKSLDDALAIVEEGHPSIKTLVVGNEYMLRVRQNFGDTPAAEERLVGYINYVRERAPQSIQVVTGESYVDWLDASAALFNAVDTVVWHVHPWWQQQSIENAATHVENAHTEMLSYMNQIGVDKPELLGETGFPWEVCNGAACGTQENQSRYLKELHQYSLQSGLEYWFFSAFDEEWKEPEGPVGDNWGMWGRDRKPHQIITNIDSLISGESLWAPH